MGLNNLIKGGSGFVVALGLLLFPAYPSPASGEASPVAPTSEAPTLEGKLTLEREFVRALKAEMGALVHRQKFEIRDLEASQRARKREWEEQEKIARREYFAKHDKGPERRTYIADFMERRKALQKMMADEKRSRLKAHEVRKKALQDDQAARLKEFREFLEKGEHPPDRLWP